MNMKHSESLPSLEGLIGHDTLIPDEPQAKVGDIFKSYEKPSVIRKFFLYQHLT